MTDGQEIVPAPDADLTGGTGRDFNAIGNMLQDGKYVVAEFTEAGPEVRIDRLERWQAFAIVAILHPPFDE